MIQITKLI